MHELGSNSTFDPMCIQGPTPVAEALSALIPGIVPRTPSSDGLGLG